MQIVSMIVLLSLILFLFFLVLCKTDFDFTSPAAIVCSMTTISILVMSWFATNYKLDLTIGCICVVFISVFAFSFSSFIKPCKLSNIAIIEDVDIYSTQVIFFSFLFLVIATILYFFEVRKVARLMGFSSSSAQGMLYFYRVATLLGGSEIEAQSAIVGQLTIASFAISYLILIDFVKRIIFNMMKENRWAFFIELITIVLFIIQCLLNGGRTQFLYYIESFVVLIVFFIGKKTGRRISSNVVKRIFLILIITIIAFYYLGSLTGKTSKLNFAETLFAYIGAPIAAFDKILLKEVSFSKLYFGSNTFIGPIDLLNRLGTDIEMKALAAPFVTLGSVQTNIYGSFGRYYSDFGIFGLVFLFLILGVLYQRFYLRLQYSTYNLELKLAVYLLVSKTLYDFCIEERFFTAVLSLGTILRIAYICIFYKLFRTHVKFGEKRLI